MKFTIVYPVNVNEQVFRAVIERKGKKEYIVELFLGDQPLDKKRMIAGSLRELISRVKHGMDKYFYTELPKKVKDETGWFG
jgi:hypothetical protein